MACNQEKKVPTKKLRVKAIAVKNEFGINYNNFLVKKDTLKSGDTFGTIISNYQLKDSLTAAQVTSKINQTFNLKNIRVGNQIITFSDLKKTTEIKHLVYIINNTSYLKVDFTDSLKVATIQTPTIIKRRTVAAALNGSLSETLSRNQVNAALASQLANIYKYSIDFFKIQKGDKFAVTIQEKFSETGKNMGIEKIEASYFEYKGKKIYAFPYKINPNQKNVEYYNEIASGAKNMFLKAPLDYFRISSKFAGRRFHPVQLRWKAHNGTDYAAPHGTPIKTTATGVVEQTGYTAGNGNFVKVKHTSNLSTQYLHLSKILVRRGQRVNQGQIIGKVGSTGLATGPHVCYRFWKNGVQVDPLKLKLPVIQPMTPAQKQKYLATIAPLKSELDQATAIQSK